MRVQSAVYAETRRIAGGTLVCFLLTNLVAFAIRKFDISIALGALLGGVCAVACFFLMALTVQRITELEGEESAKLSLGKRKMRASYMLRLAIMALTFLLAAKVPQVFNWVATAVMLIAPRLVIMAIQAYKSLRAPRASAAADAPLEAEDAKSDTDDNTEEVNGDK